MGKWAAFICAVAWATMSASPAAAAGRPSTLALVGPATSPLTAMSPSGRYFAVANRSLDPDEERKILFIDSTGVEQSIVVPLGKDTNINGLVWANDERLILVGSQRRKIRATNGIGRFEVNLVRLFSIDRRGEEFVTLFEKSDSLNATFSPPQVLSTLPDDPDHIIMAAVGNTRDSLDLWKVDVKTGEAETLFIGFKNTFAWHLDRDGAPAFRSTVNSRGTQVSTYATPDKGKTWVLVHEQVLRDATNEPLRFQPLGPTSEGRYTVIAQKPGDDRMAVHEFDLRTQQFVRTLYEHPEVDVFDALLDPMTGVYLGARFAVDKFEYAIDDAGLKPSIDQVQQALGPEVGIQIVDISLDRQRLLVLATGPQAPGDYYLFDRRKKSLDFLLSRRPELDPADLSPVEIVRSKMSDGMIITSYVTHPHGDRNGVYPLLVVPHGGPQARDYFTYDLFGQFFANRGYRVIQTNFRGSSGYGERFVEAGHRQWGKRMQQDVMESVQTLVERGIARKKNMCVYGWSYGGYVAMTASFKNADLFSASISTAGVSDLRETLATERATNEPSSGVYKYWTTAIGNVIDDRNDLNANSATQNAADVAMPVLLFHGKEDRTVEVKQSQIFRDALKAVGKPVEYYEFPDTGHGIVTFSNSTLEMMFDRIDSFCRENLPQN